MQNFVWILISGLAVTSLSASKSAIAASKLPVANDGRFLEQLLDPYRIHPLAQFNVSMSGRVGLFRRLPPELALTTNALFVSLSGNDSLAAHGQAPFASLAAAKEAAVNGDTIFVYPGTYPGMNLLKPGINWYFAAGTVVTNLVDGRGGFGYGFFDDRGTGPTTNSIDGNGEFRFSVTGYSPTVLGAIVTTNRETRIHFKAKRIEISNDDSVAGAVAALWIKDCQVLYLDVDEIFDPNTADDTIESDCSGIYWERGDVYSNVRRIKVESGYCLYGNEPPSGATNELWHSGQIVEASLGNPIYMAGVSPNYRLWVNVEEIKSDSNVGVSQIGGGKVYVTANKILGSTPINVVGGQTWITAQKVSCRGAPDAGAVGSWAALGGGAQTFLNVLNWEDETAASSDKMLAGFDLFGGTNYIGGGTARLTNAPGIRFRGQGRSRISGLTLETVNTMPGGNTNWPVLCLTNGLTLQNCALLAPSGASCVYGPEDTPQTIAVEGTLSINTWIPASITVSAPPLLSGAQFQNTAIVTSANYTNGDSDSIILMNTSAFAPTNWLPPASGCKGRKITISDYLGNAAVNSIWILPADSTDRVKGAPGATINTAYGVRTYVSDGATNWVEIGN